MCEEWLLWTTSTGSSTLDVTVFCKCFSQSRNKSEFINPDCKHIPTVPDDALWSSASDRHFRGNISVWGTQFLAYIMPHFSNYLSEFGWHCSETTLYSFKQVKRTHHTSSMHWTTNAAVCEWKTWNEMLLDNDWSMLQTWCAIQIFAKNFTEEKAVVTDSMLLWAYRNFSSGYV